VTTAPDRRSGASRVERVLAAVESSRDELVSMISRAVRVESVNPRYPGQRYEDVVGGEGRVSLLLAEIYRDLGAEVDVFALEPGRENAVGVIRGAGGRRSLIYNGHVDVVPRATLRAGIAAIHSRAASIRIGSGVADRAT
jgi:acetylornithine deacetylase/succinyl-diaminopimelate desuccinylase-like protein